MQGMSRWRPVVWALLFPSIALGWGTATLERARRDGLDVVVGEDDACALTQAGLRCWGRKFATAVPPLSHPREVGIGGLFACAIDDGGLKCWHERGEWSLVIADVTKLKNPHSLSVGPYYGCVLHDGGVACWTSEFFTSPGFSNPRKIVAGVETCVQDGAEWKCWEPNKPQSVTTIFSTPSVTEMVRDAGLTCARHAAGFSCWGKQSEVLLEVPQSEAPREFRAERFGFGLVTREGVKIWSIMGKSGLHQWPSPRLPKVKNFALGDGWACALHEGGLSCWSPHGEALSPELEVPADVQRLARSLSLGVTPRLENLEADLLEISRWLYGGKRDFLRQAAEVAGETPPLETGDVFREVTIPRALVAYAADTVLRATDSRVVREKALPRLEDAFERVNFHTKAHGLDDLSFTPKAGRVALRLIAYALADCDRYLGFEGAQREGAELSVELAKALASANGDACSRGVRALDAKRVFLESLLQAPRTRVLGGVIIKLGMYLRRGAPAAAP